MRVSIKATGLGLSLLATVLLLMGSSRAVALTFVFNFDGSVPANMQAGLTAAAATWSSLLTDSITVRANVTAAAMGAGIIGGASSYAWNGQSYGSIRSALVADATSPDDALAVANLPATTVDWRINRTSDNPNGAGSNVPYIDSGSSALNTQLSINTALAKAIGLHTDYMGPDAELQFSTAFSFDYDRSNGISGGTIDFIGVALHELGHVLGFTSGVDALDTNPGLAADSYYAKPMDLFRYSNVIGSIANDLSADTRTKYFSIDGGTSSIASFSTGVNYGDGRQASHWLEQGSSLGLMDPAVSFGEQTDPNALDLRMFDVIGWDLSSVGAGTPEPAALGWMASAVWLATFTFRRRR